MSFGFSIGDITSIIQLTVTAYRGWKDACGEYTEITGELNSLIVVLKGAEAAAKEPSSLLTRKETDHSDLKVILENLRRVVRQLNNVVTKFDKLGSSRSRNWDRLRLGTRNLEGLRSKLLLHVAALCAYLSGIGVHALGPISKKIDDLLDMKLVVDGLAEQIRAGMREGSIMTTYEDDEKVVWRQFRRELIGEGYRSRDIHRMKGPLKEYLRKLANEGLLEEASPEQLPDNEPSNELTQVESTAQGHTRETEDVLTSISLNQSDESLDYDIEQHHPSLPLRGSKDNVSEIAEITHGRSSLQDLEPFPSSSGSKDKVSIPAEIACQKPISQDNDGSQHSCHVNSISQAYTSPVLEKLGPKHPDTLGTVEDLADVYRFQGRYEEAEQLYQRALQEREEKLGPKHPDTLGTVEDLADVYRFQGRYEEAKQLYQRALQEREEKLGPKHPDTLGTVKDLADVYWFQGQYEEAEQLYQRALQGNEEKLGPKHLNTLVTVHNLGNLYSNQGRTEEAEQLYQRALQGNEEKLGPKHLHTLMTVHNLGNLYRNQGRNEEAEQLYQRALQEREEKLGPKHPDTLQTVHNLANLMCDKDQYKEAEQLYQRALQGNEEKLGPKHPDTLRTVHNLAIAYHNQGQDEEAERLFRRALQGREEKLGPKHPDTLQTVHNLANLMCDQDQYKEAEQLFRRALQGREEKLGPKHPDTLRTLRSLADYYRSQGRYEDAERLLES